jgi:hypothetical protein
MGVEAKRRGAANGRAKNSARIRYGLRMTAVRAGFEPWRGIAIIQIFAGCPCVCIRARPGEAIPSLAAQNRRGLSEDGSGALGAPSFSPYRPFAASPIRRVADSQCRLSPGFRYYRYLRAFLEHAASDARQKYDQYNTGR